MEPIWLRAAAQRSFWTHNVGVIMHHHGIESGLWSLERRLEVGPWCRSYGTSEQSIAAINRLKHSKSVNMVTTETVISVTPTLGSFNQLTIRSTGYRYCVQHLGSHFRDNWIPPAPNPRSIAPVPRIQTRYHSTY